jgi:hypothetical protein
LVRVCVILGFMHKCEYCNKEFDKPVTSGHKRKCPAFLAAKPDRKPPTCLCGHESTSLTQMKRHRAVCDTWKSRDRNAVANERITSTFEKKYGIGVTNAVKVPGAAEKKAATMKERYGAENVFCRESSLYEQVQSHWDGKDRTAHLPKDNFARPEIKEKIRQTNIIRYGAENPSQVPEIRAKQLATNLERYGDEQVLRVPEIRAKGQHTNIELYGAPDAMQSDGVKERVRQTNLDKYGVEWTTQEPITRSKMHAAQIANFGAMFFASDAGKLSYKMNEELIKQKYSDTCLAKYGVTHPMKDPEYAKKHLEHSRRAGPNKPEQKFNELYPFFCFSGNGSFWKTIPSTHQNRNPDFCFPVYCKNNGKPSFGSVTHVVEIFGNYWHGEQKTGEPDDIHAARIVKEWGEIGLKCLVVWEHELIRVHDFSALDDRITGYLDMT